MDRLRSMGMTLRTLTATAVCWVAVHGTAFAAAHPEEEESGGGAASWTLPYFVIVLGVALGMMLVCRSARRRDRAKPQTYDDAKVVTAEERASGKKKTAKKKKKKKSKRW